MIKYLFNKVKEWRESQKRLSLFNPYNPDFVKKLKSQEFVFSALGNQPTVNEPETCEICWADFKKTLPLNEGYYIDSHTVLLPRDSKYIYIIFVNPEAEYETSLPYTLVALNKEMSLLNTLSELRTNIKWTTIS